MYPADHKSCCPNPALRYTCMPSHHIVNTLKECNIAGKALVRLLWLRCKILVLLHTLDAWCKPSPCSSTPCLHTVRKNNANLSCSMLAMLPTTQLFSLDQHTFRCLQKHVHCSHACTCVYSTRPAYWLFICMLGELCLGVVLT